MHLDSRDDLNRTLSQRQHAFLEPNAALHTSFLRFAKELLDPIASHVTDSQIERQKEERSSRKRKRGSRHAAQTREELLRMKKVHVEGFEIGQVWSQVSRVVDATVQEIQKELPLTSSHTQYEDDIPPKAIKSVRFDEDGFEVGDSDEEDLGEEGVDWEYEGEDGSQGSGKDEDLQINGEDLEEDGDLSDEESLDLGGETPMSEMSETEDQPQEKFVQDKHGLNDGFFSIDDFNRRSQFLERQDARGDPDDGAASDEEDIDWELDPLSIDPRAGVSEDITKQKQIRDKEQEDDGSENEDEDEDGPTFGNADLDAPEGASDEEIDNEDNVGNEDMELGDFSNTNNILYKDFFAPPATKSGGSLGKRSGKPRERSTSPSLGQPTQLVTQDVEQLDDEIQRTMSGVHRDLFDDDDDDVSSAEEDDGLEDNLTPSQRNANLSTHERRQLALRAEIRKLEAENVSAKPWALTGETVAPARPLNSLLEEDLDFERTGKPVPIITADVNESIEDLIKRRILAQEFDEVVRRRPTDAVPGSGTDQRRGRLQNDLSDSKPTMSLAEQYEQDHLRRTDPNYVDSRSEALKKAHAQIEAQWADISSQLDSLSNWHYKPRPPSANIDVRVDAPTISMEDARPSAGGDVGAASMLAPQEVWKPGEEGKMEGQIMTKGGTAVAREEESREQKRRRRRREKERIRKANTNQPQPSTSAHPNGQTKGQQKRREKDEVVGQLKKGGVQVIGKKGELTDVEGKKKPKTDQNRQFGGESFKL